MLVLHLSIALAMAGGPTDTGLLDTPDTETGLADTGTVVADTGEAVSDTGDTPQDTGSTDDTDPKDTEDTVDSQDTVETDDTDDTDDTVDTVTPSNVTASVLSGETGGLGCQSAPSPAWGLALVPVIALMRRRSR